MQFENVLDTVLVVLAQQMDSLCSLNRLLRSCSTLAAHSQNVHIYLEIMHRLPAMTKRELRRLLVLHNNDEIPRLTGFMLVHALWSRFMLHGKYSSQNAHYCCPAEALQIALVKHGSMRGISRACVKQRARKQRRIRRKWLHTFLQHNNVDFNEVRKVAAVKNFLVHGVSLTYVLDVVHNTVTF